LKKEAFSWSEAAERAFLDLKCALMTAPVLQLPNFSRRFVVDCDASSSGFGRFFIKVMGLLLSLAGQ